MSRPFMGAALVGASITSGTVSDGTAIDAGDIVIDSVAMPAVAAAASAEARVDQLVALFNSYFTVTGVWAEKVTAATYKLTASKTITATLGATAIVATCGFVTSISDAVDAAALLASGNRVKFGSGIVTDDDAYINYGSQDINVKHAKGMGLLERVDGIDVEVAPRATYTRTDA